MIQYNIAYYYNITIHSICSNNNCHVRSLLQDAVLKLWLVACNSCKKVLVLQGCKNHARLRGKVPFSCKKFLANSILQENCKDLQEPCKSLRGNSAWARYKVSTGYSIVSVGHSKALQFTSRISMVQFKTFFSRPHKVT